MRNLRVSARENSVANLIGVIERIWVERGKGTTRLKQTGSRRETSVEDGGGIGAGPTIRCQESLQRSPEEHVLVKTWGEELPVKNLTRARVLC